MNTRLHIVILALCACAGAFVSARDTDPMDVILNTDSLPHDVDRHPDSDYEWVRDSLGAPVRTGYWHGDLDKCRQYAEQNHIPMMAMWSNTGCSHCKVTEWGLVNTNFTQWARTSGILFMFSCPRDPNGKENGSYYNWCWGPGKKTGVYPFVRFYWKRKDGTVFDFTTNGEKVTGLYGLDNDNRSHNRAGVYAAQYVETLFRNAGYNFVRYSAGEFEQAEYEAYQLLAESVTVKVVRTNDTDQAVSANVLTATFPADYNGTASTWTTSLSWAAGQTEQTVTVPLSNKSYEGNGTVALKLECEGETGSEAVIKFVPKPYLGGRFPIWVDTTNTLMRYETEPGRTRKVTVTLERRANAEYAGADILTIDYPRLAEPYADVFTTNNISVITNTVYPEVTESGTPVLVSVITNETPEIKVTTTNLPPILVTNLVDVTLSYKTNFTALADGQVTPETNTFYAAEIVPNYDVSEIDSEPMSITNLYASPKTDYKFTETNNTVSVTLTNDVEYAYYTNDLVTVETNFLYRTETAAVARAAAASGVRGLRASAVTLLADAGDVDEGTGDEDEGEVGSDPGTPQNPGAGEPEIPVEPVLSNVVITVTSNYTYKVTPCEVRLHTTNYTYTVVSTFAITNTTTVSPHSDVSVANFITQTVTETLLGTSLVVTNSWVPGETKKTFDILIPFEMKDGDRIEMKVYDAETFKLMDETSIFCVAKPVSHTNPLWIGEKTPEELAFGEWTMDLDAATNKVAATEGDAFTLVAVLGSLWCPDCKAVAANLLEKPEFDAWTTSNNIALVALDLPRMTAEGESLGAPSLLSPDAFVKASDSSVECGGTYFARKELDADPALLAAVTNRNYTLAKDVYAAYVPYEKRWHNMIAPPSFVLLRKDGSVGAVIPDDMLPYAHGERFGAPRDIQALISRLNEMLDLAKDENEAGDNNSLTTPRVLEPYAKATGSLMPTDEGDWFKLTDIPRDVSSVITLTATGAANQIAARVVRAEADRNTVLAVVTNAAEVFTFTVDVPAEGDHYLVLSPANALADKDAVGKVEAAYEVESQVGLVPTMTPKTYENDRYSSVNLLVESNVVYKLTTEARYEVDDGLVNADEDYVCYWRATRTGPAALTFRGKAQLTYQIWQTGALAFTESGTVVREADCTADGKVIPLRICRTEGSSGDVTARVRLNRTLSTAEPTRYLWPEDDVEITWTNNCGVVTNEIQELKIKNDIQCDGIQYLVFDIEFVNGLDKLGEISRYTVTIVEDDKQVAGTIGFTDAAGPDFSGFVKSQTVIARAGDTLTLTATRTGGNDGTVGAKLTAAAGELSETRLEWQNHDPAPERKVVYTVPDMPGKTVYVKMTAPDGGVRLVPGKGQVGVQIVDKDAPAFAVPAGLADETGAVVREIVQGVAENLALPVNGATGTVTVARLSGALPPGLSFKYDASATAACVTGAATASAAGKTYESVWQVSCRATGKTVKGFAVRLIYTVTPVTDIVGAFAGATARAQKTLTFTGVPVFKAVGTAEVTGLLNLTVPPGGKISAAYDCAEGRVSLACRTWSTADADGLSAELTGKGYTLALTVTDDGVTGTLTDAADTAFTFTARPSVWSKTNPATAYKGRYSVALVPDGVFTAKTAKGPAGLSLTLVSASALNSGKVSYAGWLPDGTTISGSAVLTDAGDGTATLPVFKRIAKQKTFAGAPRIDPDAETAEHVTDGDAPFVWRTAAEESVLRAVGGLYDATKDLEACCVAVSDEGVLNVFTGLAEQLGIPAADFDEAGMKVKVLPHAVRVEEKSNAFTLSFSPSTGVFSGSFKVPLADGRRTTARFKGALMLDFQDCNCIPNVVHHPLPFGYGTWWLTEKVDRTNVVHSGAIELGRASNQ